MTPEVGDLIRISGHRYGIPMEYGDEFVVVRDTCTCLIRSVYHPDNMFSVQAEGLTLLFRPNIGRQTKFGVIAGISIPLRMIHFVDNNNRDHCFELFDCYRQIVNEIKQNPLISVRIGGTCPECNGKKKVVLFTSIQPCSLCCKKQEQGLPDGVSWL